MSDQRRGSEERVVRHRAGCGSNDGRRRVGRWVRGCVDELFINTLSHQKPFTTRCRRRWSPVGRLSTSNWSEFASQPVSQSVSQSASNPVKERMVRHNIKVVGRSVGRSVGRDVSVDGLVRSLVRSFRSISRSVGRLIFALFVFLSVCLIAHRSINRSTT
jgi:hypothetical protein